MSTATQGIHEGIVYGAPVLAHASQEHRKKMARMVANKATLALRVDARRQAGDGSEGRALLRKISERINKLQEPAQNRIVKALPRPDEQKKKRRGGRVARLRKSRTAQTQLAKLKNRVMFGQAEIEDDFTGEGLGMIGQQGTGVMRVKVDESNSLKNAMGKRLKGRIEGTLANKSGKDPLNAVKEVHDHETVLAPSFAPSSRPDKNKDKEKDYFSSSAGFRGVPQNKGI
jgi:U4/U6 small nuclear ribonucleoprotein PRP31